MIVATDGAEAVRIGRERASEIDGLVTDVVLPMMGGREVASRLRLDRPALPVLYMSGYTRGTISDGELVDQHTAFLSKPFTPRTLAERVRDVLDRAGKPLG